jgi:hypothetical protein
MHRFYFDFLYPYDAHAMIVASKSFKYLKFAVFIELFVSESISVVSHITRRQTEKLYALFYRRRTAIFAGNNKQRRISALINVVHCNLKLRKFMNREVRFLSFILRT